MAILDMQRRLAEVGRIRIGQQVPAGNGKTRPAKLDTFRLTSPDQRRITQAAQLYGGTPNQWTAPAGPQWELITQTDRLDVIVPPEGMAFTQHYELWSGGGCLRRCNGQTESITDGPCLCDPEARECAIHSRLSVMLPHLVGLGVWRLETKGFYAAVELQGAVAVVALAARGGHLLPAVLRLEQRAVKRGGKTLRFAVPVLDIAVSPAQLLASPQDALDAGTIAIEAPNEMPVNIEAQDHETPFTPVPDTVPEAPAPPIAEQVKPAPKRGRPRKNAQQPIPATGIKPRTAAQATQDATTPTATDWSDLLDRDINPDKPPTLVDPPAEWLPDDDDDDAAVDAAVDAAYDQSSKEERDKLDDLAAVDPRAAGVEGPELPEGGWYVEKTPAKPDPGVARTPAEKASGVRYLITPAQLTKLAISLKEAGFDDRESRHGFVTACINRTITSAKDLTRDEASRVIDILQNDGPPDG